MAKYILCDWEINGYNDSDFMLIYYDDVTGELKEYEYDTTRFGGCTCKLPAQVEGDSSYHLHAGKVYPDHDFSKPAIEVSAEWLRWPTPEVIEAARKVLAARILERITRLDRRLRDEPTPNDISEGMMLTLTAKVRNQVSEQEPCRKCDGSGYWVNPRNSEDKRSCFTCKGQGSRKGAKAKDANGKQVWDVIEAGTVGEVISFGSFGRFYSNGYNKPHVENTSVVMRGLDGKIFRATLSKCRMMRDYRSAAELEAIADKNSQTLHWPDIGVGRCAWLTHNFAVNVLERGKAA